MSDLVRHSVTQPRTGVITYTPSILVGERPFVEAPAVQNITGALFTRAPTFYAGTVTATYTISGALFARAPTFFGGQVSPGPVSLSGATYQNVPVFFGGEVSLPAGPDTATLRVLVSAQRW